MDRSRIVSHIKPLLGERRVCNLTLGDVEAAQADIAAGKTSKARVGSRGGATTGGEGLAARTMSTLHAIFAHAVRLGKIDANPARGVRSLARGACRALRSSVCRAPPAKNDLAGRRADRASRQPLLAHGPVDHRHAGRRPDVGELHLGRIEPRRLRQDQWRDADSDGRKQFLGRPDDFRRNFDRLAGAQSEIFLWASTKVWLRCANRLGTA
jgi:hypothetical protein